jgi:hypothetical protein
MMRQVGTGIGAVIAAATLVVAGAAATTAVASEAEPPTAAELLRPAATDGAFGFYTPAQVEQAWDLVVRSFPEKLPSGYRFPADIGADYSDAAGSKNVYIHTAAVDLAAADYWRCSWLDASLATGRQIPADQFAELIDTYRALPSVATHDQTGYDTDSLTALVDARKVESPEAALFRLDCGGFKR